MRVTAPDGREVHGPRKGVILSLASVLTVLAIPLLILGLLLTIVTFPIHVVKFVVDGHGFMQPTPTGSEYVVPWWASVLVGLAIALVIL